LHGARKPDLWLLMIYAVVNKFVSMVDSFVLQTFFDYKLLTVGLNQLLRLVANFDLIAKLQNLELLINALNQIFGGVLCIYDANKVII
jgi:hypothetical protein